MYLSVETKLRQYQKLMQESTLPTAQTTPDMDGYTALEVVAPRPETQQSGHVQKQMRKFGRNGRLNVRVSL